MTLRWKSIKLRWKFIKLRTACIFGWHKPSDVWITAKLVKRTCWICHRPLIRKCGLRPKIDKVSFGCTNVDDSDVNTADVEARRTSSA